MYRVTYEASARSWALYLTSETPHRLLSFHGTKDQAVDAMHRAKEEAESVRADAMRDQLQTLRDYLEESHHDDLENDHHGDDPDDCSYCKAIAEADLLLGNDQPDPEHVATNSPAPRTDVRLHAIALLDACKAYDDDLNAREVPPTGDDYNWIFSHAMTALRALSYPDPVREAASEMLAALDVMVAQMMDTGAWQDALNGEDEPLLQAVSNAQAAIAKARA